MAKTGYAMEKVLLIRQVQDNPVYAGLVESMDDAVGEVLNTLKRLNLEDNTIFHLRQWRRGFGRCFFDG